MSTGCNLKDVEYVLSRCSDAVFFCFLVFTHLNLPSSCSTPKSVEEFNEAKTATDAAVSTPDCLTSSYCSTSPSLNDQMWKRCGKGDAAAVTALLDKGADVNAGFVTARPLFLKLLSAAIRRSLRYYARGADVKVRDTFYQATALTWALQNNHFETVRAIVEKDRESVDEVLLTGARSNEIALVRIGLEVGGANQQPDLRAGCSYRGRKG